MHPDDLKYPAVFHDGQAFFLERADTLAASHFGGPCEESITGMGYGPRQLHHVATLHGDCVEPLRHTIGGGSLRLLYGICFEGCRLKYRSTSTGVKLMDMEPVTSTPDWPYADYPTHLPYFPLRLQRRIACTWAEFSALSCQPLAPANSEAVVLVPPSPVLGMSLWGPSGDMECTQIVFRCDLDGRTVEAFNQCG